MAASHRLHGRAAKAGKSACDTDATDGCAMRSITGLALVFRTTLTAERILTDSGKQDITTTALSEVWQTGYLLC